MLFNIFINDLYLMRLDSEILNFADDKNIYSGRLDLQEIVMNLKTITDRLFE